MVASHVDYQRIAALQAGQGAVHRDGVGLGDAQGDSAADEADIRDQGANLMADKALLQEVAEGGEADLAQLRQQAFQVHQRPPASISSATHSISSDTPHSETQTVVRAGGAWPRISRYTRLNSSSCAGSVR
ncbi:hypothetical protein FQZ97_922290 [compost metagenome]